MILCSSCYYDRIYCWACFENYNLPSLNPKNLSEDKIIVVLCIYVPVAVVLLQVFDT